MKKTRQTRRARQHGGGYMTSAQFFNTNALPPTTGFFTPVVTTASTDSNIRPVLHSTFSQSGGNTRRRYRGGFVPSVMGGFLQNAQAAIVPAAMYMVYHTLVPKTDEGALKTRRMFSRKRK